MNHANSWYIAVDEVTAGPAPTELVIRGIEHRKIPPEALVCRVGAGRWDPLAAVDVFHAAVIRSYPPPPPDSKEARRWMERGFNFPPLGALPRFDIPLDGAQAAAGAIREKEQARHAGSSDAVLLGDAEVEVEWDDVGAESPIDWRDPFEPFFLLGDDIELPEEQLLLRSLAAASRETFRDQGALWNLALCLAYGSDEVGAAAARAFFDAVAGQGGAERFEWMTRTLRGSGFIASGIPEEAGQRAVERLRSGRPPRP